MSELPEGWSEVAVNDLTDAHAPICYGVLKPGERDDAIVPMVRVTDIRGDVLERSQLMLISHQLDEEFSRSRISGGDVLLSIQGTVGRVAVVPDDMPAANISRTIARIRPASLDLSRWLWAALRTPQMQEAMGEETGGTTRDSLNIGALRDISIRVPPLAEQRRIVAKLDALTARTARARADLDRIPALAARFKQAVLASCFTPESSNELVELGSIVSLENGDRGKNYPGENEQHDNGYCVFLGTRNVHHGSFDWTGAKFISKDKHELLSGGTLQRGDVVLTIRGTLGNCAVYDERAPFERVRINSAMIIVRPKGNVLPHYVMWALRSPAFLGWVSSNARGSAQPHLRAVDIKSTKVRLPDLEEQAAIVLRVERAFAEIDRLAAEASSARRLLNRLDQAVLAKAFWGELVPQDPADEPASVLLDRIRAERASAPKATRGRRKAAA
ncbi:restriction endonuclease subunit S [Brevundimonas diminuta]|uniref:restriction endonuclease subunit S n=1 Tax=Brevundimonas diminuta TaxID=293 RepID=UPI001F598616|nr:restriction endonuclease subunit S [Brevundimonas diminuta]